MRLSTKSRYGLRALCDIAYNSGTMPAQIQDISRRQEISPRYLEWTVRSAADDCGVNLDRLAYRLNSLGA